MSNGTARLIVITGPRGTGKTFLASTYEPPKRVDRVYYHDSENSANRVLEQLAAQDLAFGRYVSLKERFDDLPKDDDLLARINRGDLPWATGAQRQALIGYYLYTLNDLNKNLERGKYSVYVHDTLEKLEAGMVAWVEQNKKKAGVGRLGYGGLWIDGVYPLYEQFLSALAARGIETVILTSHLKTPWEDNRPIVGKVVPSGKKLLYFLSTLMLWLVHDASNADGAPAALVLKERLGELVASDDGAAWAPRRLLPRRIPHCTWADVERYLQSGCDLASPARGETPTDAEQEMISELLTDKQMELMILDAQADLEQARAMSAPILGERSDPELIAQQLFMSGMAADEIAVQLNRPLPLIKRWLSAAETTEQESES